ATIPGVKLKPVSGLYDERAPLGAAGTCPSGVLVYLDGVPVNALEDSDPARALRAISPVVPAPPPVSTGGGSSGGRGGRGAAIAASQAGSTLNPIRESGALPPFDINQLELSRVAAMEVYP